MEKFPISHLQVHGSQVQLDPHLQPPFSAPTPISAPSKYCFWGATPMIRLSVVLLSPEKDRSGYILHPPHPLPHLQPDPQPQFPPQQDILSLSTLTLQFTINKQTNNLERV
eukprot:TRINITY_DN5319_c0_g1_i1.p1 TRINITY_DN5319_c0_g1~~TRINITY_DN5319_c0_g1_i1.p1  ORF type:complete len:111 (-),score=22.27 TRINITY_DN5319_c0_g1_i1:69-401(-)